MGGGIGEFLESVLPIDGQTGGPTRLGPDPSWLGLHWLSHIGGPDKPLCHLIGPGLAWAYGGRAGPTAYVLGGPSWFMQAMLAQQQRPAPQAQPTILGCAGSTHPYAARPGPSLCGSVPNLSQAKSCHLFGPARLAIIDWSPCHVKEIKKWEGSLKK
jgi:hypothetical protein